MLDLPSVIVGAVAVVVGNVVVASLNHWLQSTRERKAHDRQKERDQIAHEYRLYDERLNRLRSVYLNILVDVSTLRELSHPARVGTTEEAMKNTWQTLLETKAELMKNRAALKLEQTSPPQVLSLLQDIETDVGAYVFGKQDNFRVLKTEQRPMELPFPDEELRGYLARIKANAQELEQLLATVLDSSRPIPQTHTGHIRHFLKEKEKK